MCHVHVYVHIHLTLHLCPVYIHLHYCEVYIETNGKMSSMYIYIYIFMKMVTFLFILPHIQTANTTHLIFHMFMPGVLIFIRCLQLWPFTRLYGMITPWYIYIYSNLDRSLTIIFIPKQIRNKSHLWLNPMASLKQISGFRSSHPQSGWWFWNICYFSIYGECHHPNCYSLHDFSEGLVNHQPDICNNPLTIIINHEINSIWTTNTGFI